jgi:UDP-perosamine 4-acetyltransferase
MALAWWMMAKVLCIGAGGHSSVVIDLLQSLDSRRSVTIAGIVARQPSPENVLGVPVIGDDNDLPELIGRAKATHFIVALGSIKGGDQKRPRLFARLVDLGLVPFTAVHPSAVVARSAEIGAGTVIMAGAIVQPRVRIGENTIVNTRASIDHDCLIGNHCHLAPGAICSGDVTIGENAHVGTGAIVIQGIHIGANATVGAGAAVTKDCPAGATVFGVPARPIVQSR